MPPPPTTRRDRKPDAAVAEAAGCLLALEASAPGGQIRNPTPAVRVWSPADELIILDRLAAHAAAHGAPPPRAALRDLLAGRLQDKKDFTLSEIYEKVRRLKDRYENLRDTTGPPPPPPPAPGAGAEEELELRKYELSRAIWGDAPPNRSAGVEEAYPSLAAVVDKISKAEPNGGLLKRGFGLIGDGKAAKLDAKSRKQAVLEIKTEISGDTLMKEVVNALIKCID